MNLKVAVVQFDIAWEDTSENISYLDKLLESIETDTDVVILPEMFHCGFSMSPKKNAQQEGGAVLEWMKSLSIKKEVVVVGSVIVESKNEHYNRLYVVDDNNIEWYNKRHLFSMGSEHLHYKEGDQRLIVNVRGWNICPMICYDLRFPVWSRNTNGDYDVLVYVANWPASRSSVWNTLLMARAIENQSYVVGVNRVGEDAQCEYLGESQVINARGEKELYMSNESAVMYAVLDKNKLISFRNTFPVLNDADDFSLKI